MKKLTLSIAIAASTLLVACGETQSTETRIEDQGSAISAKIHNCTDADSLRIYVDEAKAHAEKLANDGKLDEAKKYIEDIEPTIKAKAPSLFEKAFASVKSAIDKTGHELTAAKDSITDATEHVVDKSKATVTEKVSTAVSDVKETASDVADKTGEKASEIKDRTITKFNEVKNDASEKIDNAIKKRQ